jgi:hypothetical protein
MRYKIGIQLFGKLRQNSFCLDYFSALKNYLGTKGYDIDYHGCFWDEDDSITTLNKHSLDLASLSFEPYPSSGYHTQKYVEDYTDVLNQMNQTSKSTCLFLSHYLLYKSYSHRKKYQFKNQIKYDFIICQRPDFLMGLKDMEYKLHSLFKKEELISYKIYSGINNPHSNSLHFPTCYGDDFIFGGDSRTIDLFCSSYNYFYNDPKKHYYKTHHVNFAQVINTFNLWVDESWRGRLIRTENPHEDNTGAPLINLKEYKHIQSCKDDSTPSKND